MFVPVYVAFAASAGLLTILRNPSRSKAVRASEEAAHATAVDRKSPALETRRETRYRSERIGTVALLGDPSRQAPCRIVDVSRSGLRIASNRQFHKGAQVCVQWGEEFFVGAVLYTVLGKKQYISGLELLSGNHMWHPLARFCFWRRLAASRS